MFYLGEYDEAEAKEIRRFLDEAGIRIEQRPSINVDSGISYSLQGRLSTLKGTVKDLDKYERSLDALKRVLPNCKTDKEFNDQFMNELDPSFEDKKKKMLLLKEDPESLTEEERNYISQSSNDWISDILKSIGSISFAKSVLDDNGIKIGDAFENKLDDPLLNIPVNPDDYDPRPENLKRNYRFNFFRSMGIYVDELTALQAGELDEEFLDKYSEEFQKLRILGYMMEELIQSHPSRKMDLEEFADLCFIQREDKNGCLFIDGSSVAEELTKLLEKGGVLKVKGKSIKWRI
jgi:hypothetical protein